MDDTQRHKRVMKALHDIEQFMEDEGLTFDEFAELFTEACAMEGRTVKIEPLVEADIQ